MPNPAELLKLLSKLPKGSKAAQELVAAQEAARAAEKAALYAPHTPPTEKGRKALKEAKSTLAPKEEKAKEVPSIIIPGKVSNVQKKVRESKGEYGAKRVQRAADEIKNLEKLYAEEALIKAFGGDNAKALMAMNPEDFEKFAAPLILQEIEASEKGLVGASPTKATLPTNKYIDYLSGINEFSDIPYLEINKQEQGLPLIPFISGHEGRHRSRAMAQRGESAGLVQLFPRSELREPFPRKSQEEYLEALIKELEMTDNLVLPEKYMIPSDSVFDKKIQRPAIKLPNLFADGGEVQNHQIGGLAMATGGQAFPLQPEFEAEVERLRSRPRTRAGVPVEDTNVLGGALQGLANMLGGATFGRLVGTAGMPADIFEPMAAPGATIPMFGMAGMPTEISKALVQQFAPKGPDIPVPTSEFLLEKGLEKLKPAQEFEVAAKLGRYAPFDIAEMQAAGRKLKALQPALGEMLEAQMKPYQMGVAPEGKMSKEEYSRMMREKYAAQNLAQQEKKATAADLKPQEVKVPADELGFYSPAEKAAANLKRNIGTGEAFLSDLKKAPDVGESDLVHTGLENWLKGKKTVSKQEIQDYMKNNRISFIKDELKAGEGNLDELQFSREGEVLDDYDYVQSRTDDYVSDWDSYGYKPREEIREDILNRYSVDEANELIASGRIDEMVDDEIKDLAYQMASDEYYENPYRRWSNDIGYEIIGNDDVGYSISDPRGNSITPSRGVYDFETAEGVVQMHAQENGLVTEGGTQYHDYQLEGPRSNYREHLTRLNRSKGRDDLQRELEEVHRAMDDPLDQEQYNSLSRRFEELKDELSNHHRPYESSHWDGPDVVSHSRTQDRIDQEGKEILYADEIQSDWHQDGAEFGYVNKETRQKYKDLMKERAGLAADFTALRDEIPQLQNTAYHYETMKGMNPNYEKDFVEARSKLDAAGAKSKELADQIDQINMQLADMEMAVPDAPFKKDWVEKELKKLLKIAAEEGKERVAISRWQEQLKRWGTDSIAFTKLPGIIDGNNVWNVVATKGRKIKPSDLDDTITPEDIFYLNTLRNNDQRITTKNELRQVVKRDLSKGWSNAHIDRITNKVWDQMNGLEVNEIGAIDPRKEGFKATYGKSFIDTMNKLAKKLGTKTGTTRITTGYGDEIEVPYIEVTGKAKSSAIKGQPYKEGGAVHPAVDKFASSLPHPAVDKFVKRMAQGGAVYNTIPDISDAEKMIQGPAF